MSQIASGNTVTQGQKHFRNPAHARPADSDKMNMLYLLKHKTLKKKNQSTKKRLLSDVTKFLGTQLGAGSIPKGANGHLFEAERPSLTIRATEH
jgi:hypothetical protein